jgi:hypothetical protein
MEMKLVKTQTPPAGLRPFVSASEAFPKGEEAMEVLYPRCCGLDVHREAGGGLCLDHRSGATSQRDSDLPHGHQ